MHVLTCNLAIMRLLTKIAKISSRNYKNWSLWWLFLSFLFPSVPFFLFFPLFVCLFISLSLSLPPSLPPFHQGRVIEPLCDFHKDEVRALGEELGLPHDVVHRHPFPGTHIICKYKQIKNKLYMYYTENFESRTILGNLNRTDRQTERYIIIHVHCIYM